MQSISPVGNIQSGIMAGKLKGAMPAHTPRGTLKLVRSMSLLIPVRVSPNIKVVFAHRDSTTLGCIPDNQMTGRLLPGDPSSHLLLHLGVFYPARDQKYKRPGNIQIALGMGVIVSL